MGDRFFNGFIAGIVSGLCAVPINAVSINILHLAKIGFKDFSGVLIFGVLPHGVWENLVSILGFLLFCGLLGVLFSYLLPILKEHLLWIKSTIYGVTVWFVIYASTILFKIPDLEHIDLPTAVTNAFASIMFGFVLGVFLTWLNQRMRIQD